MRKLAFITSILLVASTTIADAQRGGKGYNARNMQNTERQCRIPDLTEDQEQKINELRTTHWATMKNYRADMDILRAEMRKLRVANNPEKKAIDTKIEKIGALRTKMHKAANQHRMDVRAQLTDEQKAWFDSHGHTFRSHGKGKRGYFFRSC